MYTVTLSRKAYFPPKGKDKDKIKAAKGKVSAEFQQDQKRQPNHVVIDVDSLAAHIKAGYCMRGALLEPMNDKNTDTGNGKKTYNTDKAFIKQGAILLDFDNKPSEQGSDQPPTPALQTPDGVRDLVNSKIGQNAVSVVSESWTSSEALRKWHVVLLLKEPCGDLARVKAAIKYLVEVLFKGLADKACKDPARYVLGSTPDKITQSYDGVLDLSKLPAQAFGDNGTNKFVQQTAAPPAYKAQTEQSKNGTNTVRADMTPDRLAEIILNSRCDFGAGGYSEYLSCCTALYHVAGVPSDIIAAWGSTYDGTQQNPRQWETMNRNGTFTIGTLKKYAAQLDPAAFESYKRELNERYKPDHVRTLDFDGTISEPGDITTAPATGQDPRKWTEEQWQLFADWHYKAPRKLVCAFDPDDNGAFERFKYLYIKCFEHGYLENIRLPDYIQPTYKKKKVGGADTNVIAGFCINPILLARDLAESLHAVNVPSCIQGLLYIYRDGKYIKTDPEQERGLIRERLENIDQSATMWNTKTIRDCSTILHSPLETHSLDDFNADENIINFRNGLLDLTTGQLLPHDPGVLSLIQLPLDYDPAAGTDTPNFDKMIEHISSGREDVKKMLLQVCALAVSNINISNYKMFLLIYGAKDSGKSKLFSLISRLLGAENTHITNLYLLEENRFEPMNLYGKRLAGMPELDNNSVVHHVGTIKALTGGDPIRGEIKGGGTYSFQYKGLMLFSSNSKPHLPSADDAFYKRLRLVQIPNSVADKDPRLLEKMWAERQMIINKLLPFLPELIQTGEVLDPESSVTAKKEYKAENGVEIAFFNECCTMRDQLAKVNDNQTRKFIYGKFREWCYENGIVKNIPSSGEFTKKLDSYILEEQLSTWGAKLDKRNGRFFTFTYHDPNPAQTFAAEVQNSESVTEFPLL